MLNIDLVVTKSDGSAVDVSCNTVDYVAFERHFDKPISVLEQGRITYLFWLAWHASKRLGSIDCDFDTWVESVVNIEAKDSQESIPPLGSPQLTG